MKTKKATIKELADYLNVSESAVKQYRKDKRLLMLLGLPILKDIQMNNTKHRR
jgi:predicted transcriptional regulator